MGKIQIITPEQEIILAGISKNPAISSRFYFTGGTALSAVYLKHRHSEDLDFFSYHRFEFREIADFLRNLGKIHNFSFRAQTVGFAHFCFLKFKDNRELKVDFSTYPYKQLENPLSNKYISVDSLLDIAVNKLSLLSQRTEVKDYVDLYYLLRKFTVWDLMEGVKIKFNMEIEPFILASDFTKAETFTELPKMILTLALADMKKYYRDEAVKLGRKKTTA